ncbi:hypothetical protein JIN85_07900 [Luteolibacter pohnpeiensis]|uniref:Uncharacterized protein n=1 Tax=Luteolibacter pohnpeiensis TaxID=454153 RepID=A0A934SBN2_9BACT|nr:hypothetical protein [Luteolibacter pohnpeiensis]MBK1882333.1 hypothetical protein [Luteolibacter pohnpeiensis]
MKILLGATIALLFAAVVLSWNNMTQGVRNAPADEVARLRKQVDELREQQDKLQMEKLRADTAPAPIQPAAPQPSDADIEAMKAELAAKDAELAKIQEEKDKAKRDADTFRDEAGFVGQQVLEQNDNELRRARMIRNALLIGKVKEYVENPEYGTFITVDIMMPDNVQVGSILAIRRNTGILGQIKISDITPDGAIANMMPGFGQIKPEIGDELIFPPRF